MTAPAPIGPYRAIVQRVDTAKSRVWVKITRFGGDNQYPARIVLPVGAPSAVLGATSIAVTGGSGGNVALRPLQAGDEVLVEFLEGNRDAPIVVGRLA